MLRTLALAALALSVGPGCGSLLKAMAPDAKVETKLIGTARPAVQPAAITVVENPRDLPPGFFFQQRADRKVKLYALPDWPTADAPHTIIAAYGWTGGGYGQLPDAVLEGAAKVGANRLVRLPQRAVAYAVWVSDAPPAATWPDVKAAVATAREALTDYNVLGETTDQRLEKFEPLTVPVKRGRCYALAIGLAPDATWGPAAQKMLSGMVKSNDPLIGNKSTGVAETYNTDDGFEMKAPHHGKLVRLRSIAVPAGCAWANGEIRIGLMAAGRSRALGTGRAGVQIVSYGIDDAELEQKKNARDLAMAQAQAQAEAAARREAQRRQKAAEQRALDAERRALAAESRARAGSGRRAASKGPGNYSLSLKNGCPNTVKLFLGKKPKFGSGTYSTISANSIRSFSGFAGGTLWIVDNSQNGVSSYSLSPGRHSVIITKSCSGFASR